MHSRLVSATGRKVQFGSAGMSRNSNDLTRIALPLKYKYLMPLDVEMRARILPLAQPYPKRAGSIAADAPAHQAGEGGSTPTPALQHEAV